MADELFHISIPAPPVKAGADLRGFQYKAVRFDSAVVRAATVDPTSGPAYILHNKPNSGQACTLVGPGNVTKAVAGDTITAGMVVTFNASQFCVPGSLAFYASSGAPLVLGTAYSDGSSGSVFALLVR